LILDISAEKPDRRVDAVGHEIDHDVGEHLVAAESRFLFAVRIAPGLQLFDDSGGGAERAAAASQPPAKSGAPAAATMIAANARRDSVAPGFDGLIAGSPLARRSRT
jgi:hypothetical protein